MDTGLRRYDAVGGAIGSQLTHSSITDQIPFSQADSNSVELMLPSCARIDCGSPNAYARAVQLREIKHRVNGIAAQVAQSSPQMRACPSENLTLLRLCLRFEVGNAPRERPRRSRRHQSSEDSPLRLDQGRDDHSGLRYWTRWGGALS
jgi:hypothetical protein